MRVVRVYKIAIDIAPRLEVVRLSSSFEPPLKNQIWRALFCIWLVLATSPFRRTKNLPIGYNYGNHSLWGAARQQTTEAEPQLYGEK